MLIIMLVCRQHWTISGGVSCHMQLFSPKFLSDSWLHHLQKQVQQKVLYAAKVEFKVMFTL